MIIYELNGIRRLLENHRYILFVLDNGNTAGSAYNLNRPEGNDTMKIQLSYKTASQEVQNAAVAVVTLPFKKGEKFPGLPRFVQSCIPAPAKNGEAKKPLSDAQIRRGIKWFEVLARIESLIAATDAENFVIENGYLVGSYLLGQIDWMIPTASVRFVGFDQKDWPLLKDRPVADSKITITVYHKLRDPGTEDGKCVVIPVFAEKTRISLPAFIADAIDPKSSMPVQTRQRTLVTFKYWTFLQELERLGAKTALLQGCCVLEPALVRSLANTFKKAEYIDFPEEFFGGKDSGEAAQPAVAMEKLMELKKKFAA